MIAKSENFLIPTRGKGTYEVTGQVNNFMRSTGITTGTITIFVRHTSASLVIYENADPSARDDLHRYFDKIAPANQPWFTHIFEGEDDMPAHLKMALTRTSEVVPVSNGKLMLGSWQGIFLFEHRNSPHQREVNLTALGL